MLAGCALSPDWPSLPKATATVVSINLPPPTAFIPSAEAQYTDNTRHIGMTSYSFASLPAGAILPPAPSGASEPGVKLLLDARTTIQGELYRRGVQPEPAILVLGADVSAWGSLPYQLSQAGFVVLALQVGPTTPTRQVDLMLQSLIAIPGVNAGAIGIAGEARFADLAMLACSVNTLCDALALFSPTSRDTLLNMIPSFGGRPLWLAASRQDSESYAAALALSRAASGPAQFIEAAGGRGANLLNAQPDLADQLVAWFALHLKEA
ncbi:MAG: hypothetical protein OXG53_18075 [Chloroflexi bacterium]|nr:hypothetical protein [Chloroflexota bacterium]